MPLDTFLTPWTISGLFGVTGILFVLGAKSFLRIPRGAAPGASSVHRQQMQRHAMENSSLYRMTLPLVRVMVPIASSPRLQQIRVMVTRWYSLAGNPGGYTDDELTAVAMLISLSLASLFGFCFAVIMGAAGVALAPVALPLGPLLVATSMETRAKERQHRFDQSMPYVLDLLALTLRAGTSLKLSLEVIVRDFIKEPIGQEFGQVLTEIRMGMPRRDALNQLAVRMGSDDMRSLADTLNQAEELGWPLAETVERLADRLGQSRILSAQETAGAAGVKVMLPTTLVLVAAILLLFGPTIVRGMRGELSVN